MSPLPCFSSLLSAAVLVFCSCCLVHHASATFSTKEAYPTQDAPTSSLELNDDNCLAVHLDLVARHGTRYPASSSDDFDELEAKFVSLKDFLPATGPLSWVRSWTNPFLAAESGQLALRGEKEHYGIAKRFLSRLPSLIGSQYYTPINFTIMSSAKPRCLQSASSFAFGLFEGAGSLGNAQFQPVAISSRDLEHDPLMRFYDMCPLYKQGVKKNPAAYEEYTKFFSGPEMRGVASRVSARLGVPANRQLTSVAVLVMFKVFAFEVAVLNNTRWSGVFTADDGEVLEYAMDLKKYYRNGYGHDINWQISCPLVDAVLDTMEDVIKAAVGRLDDGKPRIEARSVFRFGHAETIIPLLCYMGLFHDKEPLRADNFQRQRSRMFRGSDMAPFGGNVGFVLYHCPQGSSLDPKSDVFPLFSVKLLLNEREVPIPGCMGSPDGSCRFDRLRKLFPTKECNLKKMCRTSRQALNDLHAARTEDREAVLKDRGVRLDAFGQRDELEPGQRRGGGKQFRKYDDDDDFEDEYDDDDDDDDWRERRRHHGRRREQDLEYQEYRRRERRLDL